MALAAILSKARAPLGNNEGHSPPGVKIREKKPDLIPNPGILVVGSCASPIVFGEDALVPLPNAVQ